MGLRVFELDPSALPRRRTPAHEDVVGKFRGGKQIKEGRKVVPVTLETWRVTTGETSIAEKIAERFGGSVAEWETDKPDYLEVITDAKDVPIVLEGRKAVDVSLKLWSDTRGLLHHCDGERSLLPDDIDAETGEGKKCGCPIYFAERKRLAKEGRGPKPDIQLVFTIEGMEDVGRFRLTSGSWSFLQDVPALLADLGKVDGPARATLSRTVEEFIPKAGPMAGRLVRYVKPAVTVLGPAATVSAAGDDNPPF